MKKMMGFITILSAFLIYAFIDGYQTESVEGEDNLPYVGILQLVSHPALDDITRGITDALEEEGFVDGETMVLDFQNAQGDQSNLATMSSRFVNREADIMVGIATPAAQALANASQEIPVILGAITDPESSELVESNERPGGNVTGVSDLTPVREQLALIHELLPEVQTLGIMYSSSEDNSIIQGKMAEEFASEFGFDTETMTISSTNDVSQAGSALASKVDAIWVPTDNTIASAFPTLVEQADAQGIPIFPAVDTMVQEGGLATIGLNQYELGRLTGEMAAAVLKGESDPAVTPIQYAEEGDLFINTKKAEELGISISSSMLERATDTQNEQESE